MPRPLRIEYEGAWYHVMNRGANHQNTFLNDVHKNIFLSLLREVAEKFYVEVHAYCLMSNHYHLLLHTKLANLGKAMRHIDSLYTQRFNRIEKRDGPLFRGRYKAILIEIDEHLLQVSRYIHLNPVSANLCKFPDQYKWSSYLHYIDENIHISWLKTKSILDMLGSVNVNDIYKSFVNEGLDRETDQFYKKSQLPSIFGSKDFVYQQLKKIKDNKKIACATDINRTLLIPSIDLIAKIVSEYFGMNQDQLKQSTPGKRNDARMIAIYLSRQLGQLTHEKIAVYFTQLSRRSICTILTRCEKLMRVDQQFSEHLNGLLERLIKPV